MTFLSIVETFGAVVVALGGLELFKWVKRTWFPKKTEARIDESEATKSEIEVQQAVQDIQKTIMDMDAARIRELREANAIVNKQNTELQQQITDLNKECVRLNDIIRDKVTKIRELEDDRINLTREYEDKITCIVKEYEQKITELTRQIGHQEKLTMFYRTWHCEREYGRGKEMCLRRKPAQEPPLKYCPPELIVTELAETDPLFLPECNKCEESTTPKKTTKSKTKSK